MLTKSKIYVEKGFTLVELMISLTLGLLVSAAAIQLFLSSQKSITTQQGLSSLQNDGLFGVESLARDIRLANLNANQPYIDDSVLHGGIVLSGKNYTSARKVDNKGDNTQEPVISLISAVSNGVSEPSNLDGKKSDVLVIQYQNILDSQFDCEGKQLAKGVYVVERFFLREDINKRNDPNKSLALACKAFTYIGDTPASIDLSGNGQIIIPRVDHFSVMLGIAQDGRNANCNAADASKKDGKMDCFGYISIEDYKKLNATPKPQVVAVKIGLLIRSTTSNGQNKYFNKDQEYQVLNTKGKLTADDKNALYLRNIVTQTIAIRNGFGIEQ